MVDGELRQVENVALAFRELVEAEAPSSIALSGGETARQCYELLATADVEWEEVDVWFGDERWVPLHDPESNEGTARLAFVDQVEPREVHSMYDAGDTPEEAADAYDRALAAAPPIGIVHLGLGADGHTASLFPGAPQLGVTDRLVVTSGDDHHPHPRITLTFPGIAHSVLVVFTVAGADKQDALRRVRAGEDVPAARVRADRIVWLVDEAALGTA
jgi:6-phosphogluconolactonase